MSRRARKKLARIAALLDDGFVFFYLAAMLCVDISVRITSRIILRFCNFDPAGFVSGRFIW